MIPGLTLSVKNVDKFPTVYLASMKNGNTLSDFFQVMSWFVGVLREPMDGSLGTIVE